jgi:hypothetical protein
MSKTEGRHKEREWRYMVETRDYEACAAADFFGCALGDGFDFWATVFI